MSGVFLSAGSIFAGQFRVVRALAEGGMGAVYVVEQLSTGKQRALKVMLPGLVGDTRSRERFGLEATIASKLESDHIVEVVGAGVDDATGMPWLAMELLSGQDLESVVQARGALPREEVLDIFRQLAHGLGEAHRAGLVHRDLKPENVFLAHARRVDVRFTVKILDFGIAKVVQETKALTTTAIGTPLWMAPEQSEKVATISTRTDVWPLGLIAFYLLTGSHYWHAAVAGDTSLMALLREVVMGPIDPPSVRAKELGLGEPFPRGFDEWFLRCVVRDPAARFADATQALEALTPLLGVDPRAATMAMASPAIFETRPSTGSAPAATIAMSGILNPERTSRPSPEDARGAGATQLMSPDVVQGIVGKQGILAKQPIARTVLGASAAQSTGSGAVVPDAPPRNAPASKKDLPKSAIWIGAGGLLAVGTLIAVVGGGTDEAAPEPMALKSESGAASAAPATTSASSDESDCATARAAGTPEAWQTYRAAHPIGACIAEADRAIAMRGDEAACSDAKSANDPAKWTAYLETYPGGSCVTEAKASARKQVWLTKSFPCKAISTSAVRTCRIVTAPNGTHSINFSGDVICHDLRFGPDGDPSELRSCAAGPNMSTLVIPTQSKLQVSGEPRTWSGSHGGWRWNDGERYCCPGLWLIDPT